MITGVGDMGNIEDIEYSGIELTIGTRFYYKGKLVEVKENLDLPCSDCIFKPKRKNLYCKQNCDPDDRHDKKFVIFKEVKDE